MNSLRRSITAERNRLLKLSPLPLIQQQQNASSYTYKSTSQTFRNSKPKLPEVRSQTARALPTSTSSSSHEAVVKKPVTWPKPSEIPWQAKVVNSVNLIGQVKIPVQFETSADGKHWAGTIISQDDDASVSSNSLTSFWIPVIFEGDLAHTAMCHLKEKDYVHVAGHLSVDVPPFKLSEVQANVQVMVHSINFVQESKLRKLSTPGKLERWATTNSATVENNVSLQQSSEELNTISIKPDVLSEKSKMDVASIEKSYAESHNGAESSPVRNSTESGRLQSTRKVNKPSMLASWRDLLTNPKQWTDNRESKRKGLVKANYPDFKHKDTGVALWLNGAPVEILQGLGQLEFGGLPSKGEKSDVKEKKGEKDGESWKHLVENPGKWWDNRVDKKNKRGPDFRNKESGKGLWLGEAPAWALSSLPPLEPKSVNVDATKAWASQ
ncbi:protein OSB2, chloroplastic-like [Rutidosis leptorrhynchoides]|uniref:protein OSB2, chloroplastic-like n=1 Tax=Rutidosis leptorrhynchoides TaxID=125765 RepID=UPI003A99C401